MTEEKNISEILIDAGFEVNMPGIKKENFNPKDNWFGVSRYSPDIKFTKGEKTVYLSLQGFASANVQYDEYIKHKELWDSQSIRMVEFIDGKERKYISWTGEIPNKSFVINFINNN